MIIRDFLFFLLSPLNLLFEKMFKNRIRVLAYHTVHDSLAFEKQLKFLKSKYQIIDLDQLKNHIFEGHLLPQNSILITFDDGDISVLEKGLPILQKYSLPSVLFVITELINSNKTFWCRLVEKDYVRQGKTYAEARETVNKLKIIPNAERINFLKKLSNIETNQLSVNNLKTLQENGVFIANHTHSHPMVNMCREEELREEISHTRESFQSWELDGFDVFAYPNGNWDPKSENILMNEGIKMAFLFDHQLNKDFSVSHPMRISRIRVDSDENLSEFKVKVSGLHSEILNLRRKFS